MSQSRWLISLGAVLALATASGARADPIALSPQAKDPDTFRKFPTTGVISGAAFYKVGNKAWVTTTDALGFESAGMLKAKGFENPYLQELSSFGRGWSFDFNTDATIADKTFQVRTYQAQAPKPPASNNVAYVKGADAGSAGEAGCVKSNNCAGAEFYVHYNPAGDDPTQNVHWIQVIDDGGSLSVDAGLVITMVKGKVTAVPAPYYDDGMHTADGSGFLDFPTTTRPRRPNSTPCCFWSADPQSTNPAW
jgi:hypothetical protein